MSHQVCWTEEGARTRWCPFARVAVAMKNNSGSTEFFGVGGCNRGPRSEQVATMGASDAANPESARCIASACMAWRWSETHIKDPDNDGYTIMSGDTHGFCGLAGTPS